MYILLRILIFIIYLLGLLNMKADLESKGNGYYGAFMMILAVILQIYL